MSMRAEPLEAIPEVTAKVARKSFPKGTVAMMLRDALDGVYSDEAFKTLYPRRGRVAIAPWRLAIVVVLQAVEALSDLQAADMVRGRLDWKYALSLPLDDMGFDASILTDFRQRLVDHQAQELLLDPLIGICVQRGWIAEKGKQRVDSTTILSYGRRLSSLESVGETLRVVLNALAEQEPDWVLRVITPDWFDRYVHRFELQRFPKGKQAQEALVQAVGEDSWKLLQAMEQEDAPKEVGTCEEVVLLRKVWNQYYEQKEGKIKWRDGPAGSGAHRVVSPHDKEAREGRKREVGWLGYKVHLMETCEETDRVHLITHVDTTSATVNDVERTEALLEAIDGKGLEAKEVLMDSGYVSAEIITNQRLKGREIIGPVLSGPCMQQKTGYGLEAFALDWEKKHAVCPEGKINRRWKIGRGNRGEETVQVGFAADDCQACKAKMSCTASIKGGRTLTLYPQEIHTTLQERRAQQSGKDFQRKYAARSGIEGTLSEGVRAHGMRRSRYQGMEKTHVQMVSIAAAMNLVRIYHMLEREKGDLPPRRERACSPFARLQARATA